MSAAPIDEVDVSLGKLEKILKSDVAAAQQQIEAMKPRIGSFTSEQAARLLIASAISKIFSGDFEEALSFLDKAETKANAPQYLSQIYNYRATCLIGLRRYRDALLVMGRNLALLEKVDDPVEKRDSYFRIANLYDELEAYDEMGLYASRILDLAESEKDTKAYCYGIFLLAMSQNGRGMLKQAQEGFQNGLSYCSEHGYLLMIAMINKGLGDTVRQLGDNRAAQRYFRTALAQYQQFHFATEIVSTSAMLAQVDLALGDEQEAESMAMEVLSDSGSSYTAARRDALKVMAEIVANRDDFAKAYDYQKQYLDLNDKLFDESRVKALAYQAAHFSANEREQELKLLNKERELLLTRGMLREKEHNNMVTFASLLSVAMLMLVAFSYWGWQQKQRFMKLSRQDQLTGIYNRATVQMMGDNQFVQAMRRDAHFSLMLFDLDNFKQINDNFGFGCGDWAICRVVESVQAELSRKHIFARMGGEEFVIIMPDVDAAAAIALAEQIRQVIAAISSNRSGHQFVITASFGVSSRTPVDLSLEPLINRADKALHQAKLSGRNRVCMTPEVVADVPDVEEVLSN
ncbi:tetratricopeptide repeat-containing diguanylate cyclase [Shewanella dokdonensis]|nr:tetratricopeptide repeat-containing diguanylate cyclase [Shewanella dokdonensis]MCL1073436.1 diguanylate cyclase [Shewanella dokdonensis]